MAASSQALGTTLRPQSGTTIAGIKLQGTPTSQQALLSQVSAAFSQNVAVRQVFGFINSYRVILYNVFSIFRIVQLEFRLQADNQS